MQPKSETGFKAVEFMRQIRNELSALSQSDKKRFHEELKGAMAEFLAGRQQASKDPGAGASRVGN